MRPKISRQMKRGLTIAYSRSLKWIVLAQEIVAAVYL